MNTAEARTYLQMTYGVEVFDRSRLKDVTRSVVISMDLTSIEAGFLCLWSDPKKPGELLSRSDVMDLIIDTIIGSYSEWKLEDYFKLASRYNACPNATAVNRLLKSNYLIGMFCSLFDYFPILMEDKNLDFHPLRERFDHKNPNFIRALEIAKESGWIFVEWTYCEREWLTPQKFEEMEPYVENFRANSFVDAHNFTTLLYLIWEKKYYSGVRLEDLLKYLLTELYGCYLEIATYAAAEFINLFGIPRFVNLIENLPHFNKSQIFCRKEVLDFLWASITSSSAWLDHTGNIAHMLYYFIKPAISGNSLMLDYFLNHDALKNMEIRKYLLNQEALEDCVYECMVGGWLDCLKALSRNEPERVNPLIDKYKNIPAECGYLGMMRFIDQRMPSI